MRYIPLTQADREAMLKAMGVDSIEDLFSSIPASLRPKSKLELPPAKSEWELQQYFHEQAEKNESLPRKGWVSFLGAGCSSHFIPSVVDSLVSREEFLTAYTPYQPEISQGTLQAIFEFQSLVSNWMGMEIANASMYDGASATAEAVLMALRIKKSQQIYVSSGLHPDYFQTLRSYLSDANVEIHELELNAEGRTNLSMIREGTSCVLVSQPNFYGVLEDLAELSSRAHKAGALFVVANTEPLAFGILQPPGEHGADIVAGEGQSFGIPQNFGGPLLGFLATQKKLVRQLPGRIVGKTTDQEGREAFVLTLATREQHIRREKATSNICSNHSLNALRAAIYLSVLGSQGLQEIATQNLCFAHQLQKRFLELPGVQPVYTGPFFNEFTVRLPISTSSFLSQMEREKILGGIPIGKWDPQRPNDLLVCVTETKSGLDLDRYIFAARKAL